MNYKRFMKNSKAISPIFATLILIAIAVIAGVVVYMFTSGTLATMTAGGTAGQEKVTVQEEKVTVQAASIVVNTGGVTKIYLVQTGGPAATVNSFIFKDSSGNTVGVVSGTNAFQGGTVSTVTLTTGTLTTITGTTPAGCVLGSSYTVTVTTAAGGSFVSPSVVTTSS
ncbi:MAG: archaellin/type IV pilin N-terminal domain-containing protein [Candidatus Bathyarchaeia archaeon]